MRASRWVAAVLVVVGGLGLGGCKASQASSASAEKPAKVEAVSGSEAKKVTLTDRAVTRLGLQTGTVAAGPRGRTTVPYSALLYDTKGDTWVFEQVGSAAYLRQRITVEVVEGENVVMASGPRLGTTVVTVGAAVLYGTELGTGA